ncbi:MAG TPA: class E sortase [Acidimicrobiia bacterium]|nr:class E sortase [Acidimicrobiia bacterium]
MRRTFAAIGRMLVTVGLLILLFVTYELWGTGIVTARDQARLKSQFHKELLQVPQDNPVLTVPTSTTPRVGDRKHRTTTSTTINPKYEVAPPEGGIIGEIVIKKIGVDWIFREGVQLADLAQGPGHYPGTPLPGQIGDAAIAGHRTTHGAPFFRVNELAPGDMIHLKTFAGSYTYVVDKQPFAVDPTDYGVVANTPDAELTLTSCTPRYSAAQRIVIKAKLVRKLSDRPHRPPTRINGRRVLPPQRSQLATGLEGESNSDVPSVVWGAIVAVVGALWWWAFRRWRHPMTWIVGAIPFLMVLFPFYVYLERALPNGY